jgi:hypothetical protein
VISPWGEEGFSSCLMCPCHRAIANTPPKWFAASVSLRRAMLPSSSSEDFGLWGKIFRGYFAFTFVTAR